MGVAAALLAAVDWPAPDGGMALSGCRPAPRGSCSTRPDRYGWRLGLVQTPAGAALRHLHRLRARAYRVQRPRHLLYQAAGPPIQRVRGSAAAGGQGRHGWDRDLAEDARQLALDQRQAARVRPKE